MKHMRGYVESFCTAESQGALVQIWPPDQEENTAGALSPRNFPPGPEATPERVSKMSGGPPQLLGGGVGQTVSTKSFLASDT
jgi:hypothetical protein